MATERRLLALVLLLLAMGCGSTQGEAYLQSFAAAQRANNAGRYAEAARHFEQAAQQAKRVKDRDEAYFMRARMYDRMRKWDDTRRAYRKLIDVSPRGPRTARAVYEYAYIEIEHGDEKAGWRLLRDAILRYPNHGSARRALSRWVENKSKTDGEQTVRTELASWEAKLARTDLEQQLAYERARSLERSGELGPAREALVKLARKYPYPKGSLTDDAWWHASRIAEEMGSYQQAIADLRELLSDREVSVGGSYERPRFPQAQMRIAELYRDRLRDNKAALREFRVTYSEHAVSLIADDAMWQAALLWKHQGDTDEVCDLAESLRERVPASRYRLCARELCPEIEASKETRPCPGYLKRQLNGTSHDAR